MEHENAVGAVVGVHRTREIGRDGVLVFTLVDGNTWELRPTEFFVDKAQMLAAAHEGEIAVELWIPFNGEKSERVASYRIEKK